MLLSLRRLVTVRPERTKVQRRSVVTGGPGIHAVSQNAPDYLGAVWNLAGDPEVLGPYTSSLRCSSFRLERAKHHAAAGKKQASLRTA